MKMIKNRKSLILGFIIAVFLSGCTSTAGVSSSWPGAVYADEVGYFSYGNQVYALDGNNGDVLWRFPEEPDRDVQYYAAPAVGDKIVVVGSYANTLSALDRESGVARWRFDGANDRFVGSPLIVGDYVFAPNSDKHMYALDMKGELLWQYKTNGPNWTKPMSDGETLYFASLDHHLYALELAYSSSSLAMGDDGSKTHVPDPLWMIDLGSAVVADSEFEDGVIYVATIAGEVFAVDSSSGNILWKFNNGGGIGPIWGKPVLSGEIVYVGDERGNLYAINKNDGTPLWPTPYGAGAGLVAGGVDTPEGVLYVSNEGKVFLIDEAKKPKPVDMLEATVYSTPISVDGKVILSPATNEDLVMAIDLNGNEIWSFIPSE